MKVPKTVAIRNPRVIDVVGDELVSGIGRTYTEAAENLILEAVEARRIKRAIRSESVCSHVADDTHVAA